MRSGDSNMTSSINSEQVKEFRSLTNAEVEAVSGGALVEIAIIVGLGALAFAAAAGEFDDLWADANPF